MFGGWSVCAGAGVHSAHPRGAPYAQGLRMGEQASLVHAWHRELPTAAALLADRFVDHCGGLAHATRGDAPWILLAALPMHGNALLSGKPSCVLTRTRTSGMSMSGCWQSGHVPVSRRRAVMCVRPCSTQRCLPWMLLVLV